MATNNNKPYTHLYRESKPSLYGLLDTGPKKGNAQFSELFPA